jgi:hypothetical protein
MNDVDRRQPPSIDSPTAQRVSVEEFEGPTRRHVRAASAFVHMQDPRQQPNRTREAAADRPFVIGGDQRFHFGPTRFSGPSKPATLAKQYPCQRHRQTPSVPFSQSTARRRDDHDASVRNTPVF